MLSDRRTRPNKGGRIDARTGEAEDVFVDDREKQLLGHQISFPIFPSGLTGLEA